CFAWLMNTNLKLCRVTFVIRVRSAAKMRPKQMFGCLARVRVDSGNDEIARYIAYFEGLFRLLAEKALSLNKNSHNVSCVKTVIRTSAPVYTGTKSGTRSGADTDTMRPQVDKYMMEVQDEHK
ncbi:hypothetical protein Tco_1026522, partial [Tanacetum coccineum]